MSGGLLGAALVDLLGLVITVLGFWDCVEAIRDDAAAMNRQHELHHIVSSLADELNTIEAEFRRRGVDV